MARCSSCNQVNTTSIHDLAKRLYKHTQILQHLLQEHARFKKRMIRHPELWLQFEAHKDSLRCEISEFLYLFEDPYYYKVEIHIPDAAEIFNKFKLYLLSNRILRDL